LFEDAGITIHFLGLFLLAAVAQVITHNIKRVIGDKYSGIIAIAVGLIVAFVSKAGILNKIGFEVRWVWADQILTGLFIAGGSNVIFEALYKTGLARKPINCVDKSSRDNRKN